MIGRPRSRPPSGRRSSVCAAALAGACLLAACSDRARPSPVDPGAGMTVDITSPGDGESVRPGPLDVTIHAHDAVGRLNAIGVLLRTAPAPGNFIDSQTVHFSARVDTTVTIRVTIPRVNNPVGMELTALALNATGGVSRTGARALIVIPCPATGCPTTTSAIAPAPVARRGRDWIHAAASAPSMAWGLHLAGADSPARRPPLVEEDMVVLDHRFAECTGNWRLVGSGEERAIRCDRCDSSYPATPENRLAAIDENYAGIYLRRLTAEGLAQLESERRESAD